MTEEAVSTAVADTDAWSALLYDELRRIAHQARWRWSSHDTIGTTALVNEAYLRLADSMELRDRNRFLGLAAVAIRRILVDRVRNQLAQKRGGDVQKVELGEADGFVVEDDETVLAVHEALAGLAERSPRLARVVECQFFAGYSQSETAQALGISVATVERDWATARAWLRRELQH